MNATTLQPFLGLFRRPAFVGIWLGQFFATLADAMVQMVLVAWILKTQDSAGSEMAKTLFCFTLPAFLLSAWAGSLADKGSPPALMQRCVWARGLLLLPLLLLMGHQAVLPWGGSPAYTVYVMALLLGSASAFFVPAKQRFMPSMVPTEMLTNANALTTGSCILAVLLGGFAVGYALEVFSLKLLFGINAGVYALAALCLHLIPPYKEAAALAAAPKAGFMEEARSTWGYLKRHRHALYYMGFAIWLSVITAAFFNSINALATDYYHIGILGLSKLKGMLSIGMICGTLLTLWVGQQKRQPLLLALGFIGIFITTATVSMVTDYTLAMPWLIVIGLCNAVLMILMDTMLQRIIPNRLRGKVFGFRTTLSTFAFLVVTWVVGEALKGSSPLLMFKLIAACSFVGALMVLALDARFRHFLLRHTVLSCFRVFFPIHTQGRSQIPLSGKLILAGNHSGWLDTLILQTACRRPIYFITGAAAFQMPFIGWILPWFNVIPLHPRRPMEALDVAVKKLQGGAVVCIFPEGKLSLDGSLHPFNRGVMYLAKEAKAPILPFAIVGGFEAWGYGQKHPTLKTIHVRFATPRLIPPDVADKPAAEALRQEVQQLKDA